MEPNMTNKRLLVTAALVLVAAGTLYAFWDQVVPVAGLKVNYFRSSDAPPGTLTTEMAPPAQEVGPVALVPSSAAPTPLATSLELPNYPHTLTSERYSPPGQIDRNNVGGLTVVCTYDTKEHTGFETGPIMVNGALIGTTEHDIFSIDPSTCQENRWTHEDYVPAQFLKSIAALPVPGSGGRGQTTRSRAG
jgi:alcohol dehydrogenase (cytochrome c)